MKIINFCPITTFYEQTHINSEDDPTLYLVRTISGRVELETGTEIMVDMADGQFISEFCPLDIFDNLELLSKIKKAYKKFEEAEDDEEQTRYWYKLGELLNKIKEV